MAKKDSPFLVYVDDFNEGLRTDVTPYKAPPGSLVKAENIRYIPSGGFYLRKGYYKTAILPATGKPIYQLEKMMEFGALFIQSGTKIMYTLSDALAPYDTGVVITDGYKGTFKEYNSQMKFSNAQDNYLNFNVGKVKTAFDQTASSIAMNPGNTDLFRNPFTGTFTANASTDVISATAHGMSNGDRVAFWSSGTLPAGISPATEYFVRNTQADSYQISATAKGSILDITDTGSGTHNFTTGILYCQGNLITYTKKKTQVFTVVAATDIVTSAAHALVNDDIINVSNSGGALPAGLAAATNYWIIEATTDTFKLAATRGGAAIDITDAGSGIQTFVSIKGGDTFGGTLIIPTLSYAAGALVTQSEDEPDAPKATVLESIFEHMMAGGAIPARHAIYYSAAANTDHPEYIDNWGANGAGIELFGKYGTITAMKSLLARMYVGKQKGIEAWVGFDTSGVPVREPLTDAYGVVNHNCLIQVGDKLVFLADINRIKTIEPATVGFNPLPVINPNFDIKIKGTLRQLDIDQSAAAMGYNERDMLMRVTGNISSIPKTLIFHADTQGWAMDTNISASCWVEWNGSTYVGDSISATIYKAETLFQDDSINPAMDALSPIHVVGQWAYRKPVRALLLKGLIRKPATMKVTIYCDGVQYRVVTIDSSADYVKQNIVRPFGRESIGIDPFGLAGGDETGDNGNEFIVPIDINLECTTVQIRWQMQGEGFRGQIDAYGLLDDSAEAQALAEDAI